MSAAVIQIEPLTEEHLPMLKELARVIWRQHYPGIISHEQIDYMLEWMYAPETVLDEMQNKGIRYVRLLVNDVFSGFASFGPEADPEVIKIHKCYLLPELHGRGYGSRLLQHCEWESRRSGANRLLLTVNKQNTKAISAYERNGFVISHSVIADIGRGFVMDDFVMVKDLVF